MRMIIGSVIRIMGQEDASERAHISCANYVPRVLLGNSIIGYTINGLDTRSTSYWLPRERHTR